MYVVRLVAYKTAIRVLPISVVDLPIRPFWPRRRMNIAIAFSLHALGLGRSLAKNHFPAQINGLSMSFPPQFCDETLFGILRIVLAGLNFHLRKACFARYLEAFVATGPSQPR
ncbi:hypothetical protein PCH_Pc20g15700 [Penicillium rubens Wisconsin 54-1255]|uniref:Uncharacterized protein n=1 Tax=Penicillium rubens (strain ATCC 28089 / DSM 1075 / NRRL 1951 / Wisconsin 54-1255) TaxID=500485 RepID=B6HE59_PENRW|nr:hypothetical protein PCH_Pc20g15700 [Penicillium rubens Wisconsin 54-1255]